MLRARIVAICNRDVGSGLSALSLFLSHYALLAAVGELFHFNNRGGSTFKQWALYYPRNNCVSFVVGGHFVDDRQKLDFADGTSTPIQYVPRRIERMIPVLQKLVVRLDRYFCRKLLQCSAAYWIVPPGNIQYANRVAGYGTGAHLFCSKSNRSYEKK